MSPHLSRYPPTLKQIYLASFLRFVSTKVLKEVVPPWSLLWDPARVVVAASEVFVSVVLTLPLVFSLDKAVEGITTKESLVVLLRTIQINSQ